MDVINWERARLTVIGPSNCTDLVANNPDAFKNAYWEFGSFEVYQTS